MSVFDANSTTKTGIGTSGSGTPMPDYSLPNLGALAPNAIASRSPFQMFASGMVTGEDLTVIHGDFWEQIGTSAAAGNNVTRNIRGDETQTIEGSETITVRHDLNQEVYGQTYYLYVDTSDINHVETVTVNYQSPVNYQQPTSWFQTSTSIGLSYNFQIQFGVINTQFVATNLQFFASQLQIVIWNFNANFVNFNPDGGKITLWGLEAKINELGATIRDFEAKVGGAIVHGVGVTVKTIIVGINQIF